MHKKQTIIANDDILYRLLTNEEFDSLISNIQFLQSSQMNYIMKKFSIPITNNNTNITKSLLLYFQSLRNETILTSIYNDINKFFLENEISLYNELQIVQYDDYFESPLNSLYLQSNQPFIFGPIFVQPGESLGHFQFNCSNSSINSESLVNICFLFKDRIAHQFEIIADFNGTPIEISIDDPFPQPIDITNIMHFDSNINSFNIKIIRSSKPMMICIREYFFHSIEKLIEEMFGKQINSNEEDLYVYSLKCDHDGYFSIIDFISTSFATGECKCPICSRHINMNELKLI